MTTLSLEIQKLSAGRCIFLTQGQLGILPARVRCEMPFLVFRDVVVNNDCQLNRTGNCLRDAPLCLPERGFLDPVNWDGKIHSQCDTIPWPGVPDKEKGCGHLAEIHPLKIFFQKWYGCHLKSCKAMTNFPWTCSAERTSYKTPKFSQASRCTDIKVMSF